MGRRRELERVERVPARELRDVRDLQAGQRPTAAAEDELRRGGARRARSGRSARGRLRRVPRARRGRPRDPPRSVVTSPTGASVSRRNANVRTRTLALSAHWTSSIATSTGRVRASPARTSDTASATLDGSTAAPPTLRRSAASSATRLTSGRLGHLLGAEVPEEVDEHAERQLDLGLRRPRDQHVEPVRSCVLHDRGPDGRLPDARLARRARARRVAAPPRREGGVPPRARAPGRRPRCSQWTSARALSGVADAGARKLWGFPGRDRLADRPTVAWWQPEDASRRWRSWA